MEDSLTHAVWNSEKEKKVVVDDWRRRYVMFLQDILKPKKPSISEADKKKQEQASGNVHRASNMSVRPAASSVQATGPSTTTTTGAKLAGPQGRMPSRQTPNLVGTSTELPNRTARTTPTKPGTK